ncbi:MAG: hypothetical protein J0H32_02415, partial [Rhizobiales bacterium]|nr:hypothetical protein [Hyphomicrobiales bacterium]
MMAEHGNFVNAVTSVSSLPAQGRRFLANDIARSNKKGGREAALFNLDGAGNYSPAASRGVASAFGR